MAQTLYLSPRKHIYELQQEFAAFYPYLRLDLFHHQYSDVAARPVKIIARSSLLAAAGLKGEGTMDISDTMTIAELESAMKERFGLLVQVIRQSGTIWLETTMTDDWTLKQQNDHGRELSKHIVADRSEDFDLGRGNLS
ncbi:MAG TPA: hypothetical protein VHN59_17775 [Chitinophagaceae bacterium]|nr:hypothetical protein [Chitinophagaceae bacterium]